MCVGVPYADFISHPPFFFIDTKVAVKIYKQSFKTISAEDVAHYLSEIKVWQQLRHPNICLYM